MDPMLFSDEDGRLYFYWGCTKDGGIWGVELDAGEPDQGPHHAEGVDPLRSRRPAVGGLGEWNQDTQCRLDGGCVDAQAQREILPHLLRRRHGEPHLRDGLLHGAIAARAVYTAEAQSDFPHHRGLVTGTAHGCIVAGPENRLWAFYTVRAGVAHAFERRIGMDRVEIDANGELFVPAATSLAAMAARKNSCRAKISRHRLAADQRRAADGRLHHRSQPPGRPCRGQ